VSGFLLRSTPKGTICLLAIGPWEEGSFFAAGDEKIVGMALEVSRGLFIWGRKGQHGSRSIHNGSCNIL
jgi:hypothetical protein